ncbi:MAG: YdcF family protein [Bryobacteraceae bacterium]|nr:YdcF family protein [Bryobacteraceae bacterium]
MRRLLWILFALLAATAVVGGLRTASLMLQIDRQSSQDEARKVDVIVILGAAEYRGRPSPVFKARLDHGLELYRRGIAPHILTTGGAGGDPDFTESEVGRAYLIQHGVPSEVIILEPAGESTVHSAAASAEIMRRMNLDSCVVVSDGYHIFRAKKLLEEHGMKVYGSPRPSPRRSDWRYWRLCFRQAVGYMLWSMGVRV